MPRSAKNIGASVRARLLAISKEKGQNFDLVLTHYAIERLLYDWLNPDTPTVSF